MSLSSSTYTALHYNPLDGVPYSRSVQLKHVYTNRWRLHIDGHENIVSARGNAQHTNTEGTYESPQTNEHD